MAMNMDKLNACLPVVVTDAGPFKQILDRVVSALSKTNHASEVTTQSLSRVPSSPRDAADLLRPFGFSFLHVVEYANCFVLSNAEKPLPSPFSPEGIEFLTRTNSVQVVLDQLACDTNAFMSGVIILKGSARFQLYDFTRSYIITPQGINIVDHRDNTAVEERQMLEPNKEHEDVARKLDNPKY